MTQGFTNKEILTRILDKMESVETKVNATHELAVQTNGKVKMHTKIIFSLCGAILSITGWLISTFINN